MQVIFRVRVYDPAMATLRQFAHQVMDMPYPFVPTTETWAQLPSDDPSGHLGVFRVLKQSLNVDGSVVLDFSFQGRDEHSAEEQMKALLAAGYSECGAPV